MKKNAKIAVIAMVFSIIASSSLFAIDLADGFSLEGQLLTGARLDTTYEGDETKSTIYLNNDDDEQGNRYRVTATYQGDWGGIKGRLGFETKDAKDGIQPMNGTGAYAWANGFNKLITVSGGVILDAVWGSSGYVAKALDDRPGIRLEIKPIEGLNLGLGLNVPSDSSSKSAPELANAFKDGLYFGAKYAHPAFIVNVAGRLTSNQNEDDEKSGFEALFGLKIPLNPLTIDIDGWFATEDAVSSKNGFFGYNVIAGADGGYLPGFRVAPRVTYSQDAITAYLVADIRAGTPDDGEKQAKTEAAGDARIEIRAQGAYKISDIWQPFLRIGVENVAAIEYGPLYVRFGNTFKIAPNATISLYDQINNIGGSEDAGTDHIANRVYVGFNYTF